MIFMLYCFLDEDVDFEKDLAALVIEVSTEANFRCYECSIVCNTQRGLTRDKNTKHSSTRSGCGVSVSTEEINDLCLPQESRDFFGKNLCLHLKILFKI